ncbi:MAG: response regulator [Desulfurivibrionaceae bacterium]
MTKDNQKPHDKFAELRKRAGDWINRGEEEVSSPQLSLNEGRELLQELNTYQIELELQNEDLRQTQAELDNARRKYTDLYDFAPISYLTLNEKGMISEANLTASELLGVPRARLLNRPLSAFIVDDDQNIYFQCRKKLLRSGEKQTGEVRIRRSNGTILPVLMEGVINARLDGDSGQFRVIIMNISRRKELEAELFEFRKMEAIGSLAAGIAHDFNNILTSCLGYAEMAMEEVGENSKARQDIEQVITAAHRATELVKRIHTFSRQGIEAKKPLAPAPVVKEALQLLRASLPATVEIVEEIDDNSGLIIAAPNMIHQIMINLGTNAFHAMEGEKGILSIKTARVKLRENDLPAAPELRPGNYMELTVKDTGHGMDRATVERIFDPYFTTKKVDKGSGMGMSLIHGIVKDCGGFLKIESAPDRGTSVSIYFPIVGETEEREVEKGNVPIELPSTGNEHILLVDDEKNIARIFKQILEQFGYKVTAHFSSIETLETFRAAPDSFDLVLTDQRMPWQSGMELAARIREIRPDMPIVLCTGYSSSIDEKEAEEIGIKRIIMKPIGAAALAKNIREVLDQ